MSGVASHMQPEDVLAYTPIYSDIRDMHDMGNREALAAQQLQDLDQDLVLTDVSRNRFASTLNELRFYLRGGSNLAKESLGQHLVHEADAVHHGAAEDPRRAARRPRRLREGARAGLTMAEDWVEAVLRFWFEELKPRAWFRTDPKLDDEIRRRFLEFWDTLRAAPLRIVDARTAVAAVVVLDQFPRNLFRGGAEAFATDAEALAVARAAIAAGPRSGPAGRGADVPLHALPARRGRCPTSSAPSSFSRPSPSRARSRRRSGTRPWSTVSAVSPTATPRSAGSRRRRRSSM